MENFGCATLVALAGTKVPIPNILMVEVFDSVKIYNISGVGRIR